MLTRSKAPTGPARVTLSGDIRYRYEYIADDTALNAAGVDDSRPHSRSHPRALQRGRQSDRQHQRRHRLRDDRRRRSALVEPVADRRLQPQGARPRPRLLRLEVRELGQPGRRQDAPSVRQGRPEPVLGQRPQSGRSRLRLQSRHVVRQRLQLLAQRSVRRREHADLRPDDARLADRCARAGRQRDADAGRALLRPERVAGQDGGGAVLQRLCQRQHDHRHCAEHRARVRLRSDRRAGPVRDHGRQPAAAGLGRVRQQPGSG